MDDDFVFLDHNAYVRQYIQLAHDVQMNNLDGTVIGAPSKNNNLTQDEIRRARRYLREKATLIPGIGKQGGETDVIFKYFIPEKCIANVGRALMFPDGGDQVAAAKHYQKMLNELRQAA